MVRHPRRDYGAGGTALATAPEGGPYGGGSRGRTAGTGRAERPDYTPMLPTIAVPTLVVVGSDDVFTPVADAEFLHRRIPGARLAVIEGAGHLPNLERPAAFDDVLAGLLATVRQSVRHTTDVTEF